ncbi:MAG: transporter substrate-binding domain-containing protein [Marinobacter sp.]|uniref:substrate-binding periplasmic protein n=1 Tax=Marinobacter sp. TaxID=50741 RepID=UPI00299E7AF5|nr:transporter substrate-binding domain-containing protein [Marinobacter sp.]MDX1755742.1 transporter substrate-binding domain-containing protein [Marinobacter sp.]
MLFKKLLIVVLAAAIGGWHSTSAGRSLKVGFFELPPHVYGAKSAGNHAQGPAIEYLHKIAASMGVTLEVQSRALPLSRLVHALAMGEIDVALAMAKNPVRDGMFRFPEKPFFQMRPALMVMQPSRIQDITDFDALADLRIGVYADGYLSPMLEGLATFSIHGEKVIHRGYQIMEWGRLDAVYSADSLDLYSNAAIYGFQKNVRIIELPEQATGLYTVFSSNVPAEVIAEYEQALRRMEPYSSFLKNFVIMNTTQSTAQAAW